MSLKSLKPDIAGALARLSSTKRSRAFPIPTSTFSVQRKKELLKRKDRGLARRFIRPENAAAVMADLPREEGDRMHAVVAGDFVFADLLLAIARERPPAILAVATLSLSRKNVDAIAAALDDCAIARFELCLSHYFQSTSKELFAALQTSLADRPNCRVVTARTHCKVALFSWPAGGVPLVIESSANLRSSGNLEQISAFADSELHAFHRGIFDQILAREAHLDEP